MIPAALSDPPGILKVKEGGTMTETPTLAEVVAEAIEFFANNPGDFDFDDEWMGCMPDERW